MNGNIGMRALSTLFAVLLVSVAMVPAMACEPGTPCGDAELDLQKPICRVWRSTKLLLLL